MNLKIVNHSNNSDMAINKKISDIMLNQYKKGLNIKNNELTEESGQSGQSDTVLYANASRRASVDVVNPSQTLRVPMQKNNSKQTIKGYLAKDSHNNLNIPTNTNNNTSKAKEFIIQSRILDNELDQMIGMLKINNKDEFYNQSKPKSIPVSGEKSDVPVSIDIPDTDIGLPSEKRSPSKKRRGKNSPIPYTGGGFDKEHKIHLKTKSIEEIYTLLQNTINIYKLKQNDPDFDLDELKNLEEDIQFLEDLFHEKEQPESYPENQPKSEPSILFSEKDIKKFRAAPIDQVQELLIGLKIDYKNDKDHPKANQDKLKKLYSSIVYLEDLIQEKLLHEALTKSIKLSQEAETKPVKQNRYKKMNENEKDVFTSCPIKDIKKKLKLLILDLNTNKMMVILLME